MRLSLIIFLITLSSKVSGFELVIFNKAWNPEGKCQLVASDAKYGFGTHMRCDNENVSLEIYFDQVCPMETLNSASKKLGNSQTVHVAEGVEYKVYKLKNINTGKFETIRVIENGTHCVMSPYDNINISESPLKGLWQ